MSETAGPDRYDIRCPACDRRIAVRHDWVERDVACPHCQTALTVPPPGPADAPPPRGMKASLTLKRYFNFACGRCDALLEANTGMSGREGRCPTCGARFIVPKLRRRSGRPTKTQMLESADDDPTAMHAYGSSGMAAPTFETAADGQTLLVCPRCDERNAVDADFCEACGAPFTLEGAPTAASETSRTMGLGAMVLGIVAWPLFFLIVPGLIAGVLGAAAFWRSPRRSRPVMAIIGAVLGFGAAGVGVWRLL